MPMLTAEKRYQIGPICSGMIDECLRGRTLRVTDAAILPCGSIFSNYDLFFEHMHAESWGRGTRGNARSNKGGKCGRKGSLGNIWRYGTTHV